MSEKLQEQLVKLAEAIASEKFTDPGESFDNFMSVTLGDKTYFDMNEGELKQVRDFARKLAASDELVTAIIELFVTHIVGDGLYTQITPKELGKDPEKIADIIESDPQIKTLRDNWEAFTTVNKFNGVAKNWIIRRHRDGEAILRLFRDAKIQFGSLKVPAIRFIEPDYIKGDNGKDIRHGIKTDPNDVMSILAYLYNTDGEAKPIDPKDVIHDKANVDVNFYRGFTTFYSIFTNIRRISKNLVNVSVLTGIQSAIALIRKHDTANQSKLQTFVARNSDGRPRINSGSGKPQLAVQLGAGTVIDAGPGIDYDFPAHQIKADQYIEVIKREIGTVATRTHLPLPWLLGEELQKPLSEGSPTVKFLRGEQGSLFDQVIELFWMVQESMGVNPDIRQKYNITVFGPELAVGTAEEEARVGEIEVRNGVLSPQTWAARRRRNWLIERAQTIQHRRTKQPGEVMPGDAGNTNVSNTQPSASDGGDGKTKKNPQQQEEVDLDNIEVVVENGQLIIKPKHG